MQPLTNCFLFRSESSGDPQKEAGIELLTSTIEEVAVEKNQALALKSTEDPGDPVSRPPTQSQHSTLASVEPKQALDSIVPHAGRTETTLEERSGEFLPVKTESDAKTEGTSTDEPTKLSATGTESGQYLESINKSVPGMEREDEEGSPAHDTKGRMTPVSSISDEELVETDFAEEKVFPVRAEAPLVTKLPVQSLVEFEEDKDKSRESQIRWESSSDTRLYETVRAVVIQSLSADSSEADSSISIGKATDVAHEIVERVIEEAKIKSLQSTPEHQIKRQTSVSSSEPSQEVKALAQEIVQNVIDEVLRRLSLNDLGDSKLQQEMSDAKSGTERSAVVIKYTAAASPSSSDHHGVRMRSSRSSAERDKESGSGSEAPYHSCETSDAKSPIYSRPTSGELDVHLFPGQGSSVAGGSSEYETCATSQGSGTTFASALASQDTSYATARSSLSSQQSSRGSTLEPDSEADSSGHPGDLSSEASETIIPGDDRDLATPTIRDVEGDGDESHDSLTITDVQEPYDLPIPEDVIRGHEGPFMGHLIAAGTVRPGLPCLEEEPPSISEGTWHSSSLRTAIPGVKDQRRSDSDSSVTTPGHSVVHQTLVSPLSIEGSIASIDLVSGSQLSQSSVR